MYFGLRFLSRFALQIYFGLHFQFRRAHYHSRNSLYRLRKDKIIIYFISIQRVKTNFQKQLNLNRFVSVKFCNMTFYAQNFFVVGNYFSSLDKMHNNVGTQHFEIASTSSMDSYVTHVYSAGTIYCTTLENIP
jgi:hypothetical protein